MDRRPILAGVLLGLLTYKPHLGLLFPVALIAGRHWRVFVSAAVAAMLLAAASWLAFGTECWQAFFASIGHSEQAFLSQGHGDWRKLQTAFGLMRTLGSSEALAWTVQAAISLITAGAIALLWRRDGAQEIKSAALGCGVLLATPYLYAYDLVVLALPLAFLFRLGRTHGFLRHELAGIGLACLLVLIFPFVKLPVGFGAVLVVAALIARRALAPRATEATDRAPPACWHHSFQGNARALMLHCSKIRITLAPSAIMQRQCSTSRPARNKSPGFSAPMRDIPTAAASNALYRKNLSKGQTGLSVAFDLPTQTGYDSDHPLAKGEVGKVGVPISHLGDMRALFDGIPLGAMNTSMTINATAAWLLALYIAVADEQGVPRATLQGTTQNDIIKEYLSRGTYVFPPAPSMRLIKDTILFTTREMPKWNPMNVCSYHLQEAGATPEQELAFALATAIAVLDTREGDRRRQRFRRGGRPHFLLRQRLDAVRRRNVQDARVRRIVGQDHARALRRRPIPSSGCSATACRSIRSGSPSSSRRTTSTAFSSRCSR